MVKLKDLFIKILPLLSYIVAMAQYFLLTYGLSKLWAHPLPLIQYPVTILLIILACGIMYTAKIVKNYILNKFNNSIKVSKRILLAPIINTKNFILYFSRAHKLYMEAVKSETPTQTIEYFWVHLEKPFKKEKDFLDQFN